MSFGAFQSTHSHTRVSELDHARLNGIDFLSTENDPWVESTLSAMSDAQECARGKFPMRRKKMKWRFSYQKRHLLIFFARIWRKEESCSESDSEPSESLQVTHLRRISYRGHPLQQGSHSSRKAIFIFFRKNLVRHQRMTREWIRHHRSSWRGSKHSNEQGKQDRRKQWKKSRNMCQVGKILSKNRKTHFIFLYLCTVPELVGNIIRIWSI